MNRHPQILFKNSQYNSLKADECVKFDPNMIANSETLQCLNTLSELDNVENNRYFYHSDHIGSSSFITDRNGYALQHLQYLPFGELFVEQRATANYYTPYKFSGKEKDEETSYSYFGARYYLSDISVWASVDPMWEERSWLSPYNYCQLNPIMLTDPTGMLDDGYTIDENGNVVWADHTGGDSYDVLYNKSKYDAGKRDYDESGDKSGLKLNNTNILPALEKSTNVDVQTGWDAETGAIIETFKLSQYSTGNNSTKSTKNEMLKLFYFASDNSKNAEWRLHKTKQGSFNISTFHQSSDAPSDYYLGVKTSNVDWMIHSHPDTKNNITAEKNSMAVDGVSAKSYNSYYVYFPKSKRIWTIYKNNTTSYKSRK